MTYSEDTKAIAVYCGSLFGKEPAYAAAARSVGKALADADYRLVYGGGVSGIMGAVSNATLDAGGRVVGIVPKQMIAAGGEGDKERKGTRNVVNSEREETIVVNSMHERKVEMARRVKGFVGLPGGFGTFEEVLEAVTWTQIGIHKKPVVLLNVHNFYNPLRQLVESATTAGFIKPANKGAMIFVDGPEDFSLHDSFDWGSAAIKAVEEWNAEGAQPLFAWYSGKLPGSGEEDALAAT